MNDGYKGQGPSPNLTHGPPDAVLEEAGGLQKLRLNYDLMRQ